MRDLSGKTVKFCCEKCGFKTEGVIVGFTFYIKRREFCELVCLTCGDPKLVEITGQEVDDG